MSKSRVEIRDGSTTAVGLDATNLFSLIALVSALKLEIKVPGMRLSRGRSALGVAKHRTGLKTNKREVHIARLEEMIAELRAQVEYVDLRTN